MSAPDFFGDLPFADDQFDTSVAMEEMTNLTFSKKALTKKAKLKIDANAKENLAKREKAVNDTSTPPPKTLYSVKLPQLKSTKISSTEKHAFNDPKTSIPLTSYIVDYGFIALLIIALIVCIVLGFIKTVQAKTQKYARISTGLVGAGLVGAFIYKWQT